MTDDLISTNDQSNTFFDALVGPGRKFKDQEALARGKDLADTYITTLEGQLDVYREELLKLREQNVAQAKIGDLVDRLDLPRRDVQPPVTEKPHIDPKQFESLIDDRIKERDSLNRQNENFKLVRGKIEERLGKDFSNALQEKIQELDITPDHLNMMARTNPKAAIRLLGLDQSAQQESFQAPPGTRVRTDSFKPVQEKRTWSWYQNLKNTDPKRYYNPATNVQMHRDAQNLGTEFQDGSFNVYGQDHRITY